MKIYKQFKIASQAISVRLEESLPNGEYGKFVDAKNTIYLAKTVEEDDEIITLSSSQIENTFWHEVIHAFQFYYNNEYDEAQAQVFANFLCETLNSGEEQWLE